MELGVENGTSLNYTVGDMGPGMGLVHNDDIRIRAGCYSPGSGRGTQIIPGAGGHLSEGRYRASGVFFPRNAAWRRDSGNNRNQAGTQILFEHIRGFETAAGGAVPH